MGLSLGHLVVILAIVLLLFGAGRLPQVMGDLAKGLRSFKNNLKEEDDDGYDVPKKKTKKRK